MEEGETVESVVELMTADDVARLLSVSPWYVTRLARLGELNGLNLAPVGARAMWRFSRADVNAFLARRMGPTIEPKKRRRA